MVLVLVAMVVEGGGGGGGGLVRGDAENEMDGMQMNNGLENSLRVGLGNILCEEAPPAPTPPPYRCRYICSR